MIGLCYCKKKKIFVLVSKDVLQLHLNYMENPHVIAQSYYYLAKDSA